MKRVLPLCVALLVVGWLALDRFEPATSPGPERPPVGGRSGPGVDVARLPGKTEATAGVPLTHDPRPPTGDPTPFGRAAAAGFDVRDLGVPGGWRELRAHERGARPLVLAEPPRRIVSQALVADEILLALDVGERLVAVSRPSLEPRFSMVVREASRVGVTVAGSAEQILSLRPDLVFLAAYTTPETQRQLALADAPAIRLDRFDSLDAVRGNVEVVGFAVGKDAAAARLVEEMDRRLEDARRRARRSLGARAPRVLAFEDGAVPAGATIFHDVVTLLGARNVAAEAGLSGWPRVAAEQIASWDPDLLFAPAEPGEREALLRFLLAQPGVGETRAVRAGAVATVPRAAFSTVSHHVAVLAESLADSLEAWSKGVAPGG
jgi:iron complex transport system substrate-binding protein